jgi:uncharacterized protein (TIGR03437 family)
MSDAASYQATFSPGSIAAIFGKGFGSTRPQSRLAQRPPSFCPTGRIRRQVNVQLPVDAPIGPTTLTVTAEGRTSAPMSLTIAAYAPAFFTANASGSGVGSFLDWVTAKVLNVSNPASPGETVTGTAIGLGATTPAYATHATATAAASTAAKATLAIGTESVAPLYAGTSLGFLSAFYQVNFTVPKDATGCATNVVLTIGDISSLPVTLPNYAPPAGIVRHSERRHQRHKGCGLPCYA